MVLTACLATESPNQGDFMAKLACTLEQDIKEWLPDFVEPILAAAAMFCLECPEPEGVVDLVRAVTTSVRGLGTVLDPRRKQHGRFGDLDHKGGKVHIAFLRKLVMAENVKCKRFPGDRPFLQCVLSLSMNFVPHLLLHEEMDVREATLDLLGNIINDKIPKDPRDLDDTRSHHLTYMRASAARVIFSKCRQTILEAWQHQYPKWFIESTAEALELCATWLYNLRATEDGLPPGDARFSKPDVDARIVREWYATNAKIRDWPAGEEEDGPSGEQFK